MHDRKNGETAGDGSPSLQQLIDHEGTTFSIANADTRLELETIDTSWDVTEGWERFTLVFDADEGTALEQTTHRLESGGLDPFDVTVSRTPTLDTDRPRYEAVFNRRTPDRDAADLLGSSQEAVSADRGDVDGPNSTDDASGLGIGMEPYLGTVGMFAVNFAPQRYMRCNGTTVQVSQNQALFSLLGTTYGGNGRTTFGIPDLRGRTPIGIGAGNGPLSQELGETGGEEQVLLSTEEMPAHTHAARSELPVSRGGANSTAPVGHHLARSDDVEIYTDQSANASMSVDTDVGQRGQGMAHDNMPPYLAINYVIAIQGVYPIRP